MSKLWILLLFSLILAFFAEIRDNTLLNEKRRHDKFFTFLLIIMLASFCGLRVWYNDTVTYLQMYNQAPPLDAFSTSADAKLASGWGFGLLNSLIKELGFSSQDYLMLYAFLTVTPYVLFVRRCCPHFAFGIFLMFATGMYTFTLAAIKQCMATGICLMAVMAAMDKKWIRYFLLIVLAFLFHPYSIVYLIVPLMMFKPWTKWTYFYVFVFVAVGFMLNSLIGTILDVTDMIGADYDIETFTGEGVNFFRVAVSFVPLLLAFPYKRMLFTDGKKTEYLLFNLCTIHAMIMFVGVFGTANYFARLANYFLPMVVVVLPQMLNKLYVWHRPFWKTACVIGYLGFFYFEHGVKQNFDTHLSQIGLWDYIISHF